MLVPNIGHNEGIFVLNALCYREVRLYIRSRYGKPSFNEITLIKVLQSPDCSACIPYRIIRSGVVPECSVPSSKSVQGSLVHFALLHVNLDRQML